MKTNSTNSTTQEEPAGEEQVGTGMPCPLCALTRALQLENLVGAETARHLRRSQKEMLLAVRSAINSAIENLEKERARPRAERIEVD